MGLWTLIECGRNVHEHGFGNMAGEYWFGLIKCII